MSFEILNRKKIKEILKIIEHQWGAKPELDYAFLKSPKEKLYLVSKDIAHIELSNMRINNISLYFGELRNHELRLSIEGSQLIGPSATKNIIELNKNQVREWFRGESIELEREGNAFVLLKYKNDFLGCGKLAGGRVLNYVPKARRVNII